MLKLVISNSLHALASSLAHFFKSLYASKNDLQAQSTLIVPSEAMASYVRREMASILGVCANLSFCTHIHALFESCVLGQHHNGLVWTEHDLFSVLYPYFSSQMPAEIAISRAQTHASALLQLGYDHPEVLFKYRQGRLPEVENQKQILRSFDRILAASGGKIKLPIEYLGKGLKNLQTLPQNIHILDPVPLTAFERGWLSELSKHPKIDVHVYAFNPCHQYWSDLECRVKHEETPIPQPQNKTTPFLQSTDSENASPEDSQKPLETSQDSKTDEALAKNFLLNRCGRISQQCARDWIELVDSPLLKIYASYDEEETTTLQQIQVDTAQLSNHSGNYPSDDSIVFRGFKDAREEVAWIASQIETIASKTPDLSLESVVVLVPYSQLEMYGMFIRAEFVRRQIPHNIHALISQPLEVCYSAFTAFTEFLCDLGSRETVMQWAFHEGVIDREEGLDKFAQVVDLMGIYGGLDAKTRQILGNSAYLEDSESFTWSKGIAQLSAACLHTHETAGDKTLQALEHEQQFSALQCWQRIRAMLEDHRVVRTQHLGYAQWREFLYALFDTWLRADVMNREMAMGRLWALLEQKWPTDIESASKHSFTEIIPLLRAFVRSLDNEESGRITGGVQVRPMACDVFTSDYVFFCGQHHANFPSQKPGKRSYAFSQEDIDAHAWLKWFTNVQTQLCITAAVPEAEVEEHLGSPSIKLSHFSFFAADLGTHLGIEWVTLHSEQDANARYAALRGMRQAWHEEHGSHTQAWPMQIADFGEKRAAKLKQILNGAFEHTKDNTNEDNTNVVRPEKKRNTDKTVHTQAADTNTEPEDSKEQSLAWQALYEMFYHPRKAWRRYYLGISDSYPLTPRQKIFVTAEPIECVASDYGMRTALEDVMRYGFASGLHNLEAFVDCYDALMVLFQSSGLYPDMVYGKLQRERDLRALRNFVTKMPQLQICTPPTIYRLEHTRNHHGWIANWFAKHFQVQVKEIPSPVFDVKGPDDKTLHLRLSGDLPLVLQSETGHAFVQLSSDWALASMAAGVALCVMCSANNTPPTQVIAFDHKGTFLPTGKTTPKPLQIPTLEGALEMLRFLSASFTQGHHELCFSDTWKPTQSDNLDLEKVKLTPLYRYLGDDKAWDRLSLQHWTQVLSDSHFSLFKTWCGL